jgi:hypothetical protein
MGTFLNTLWTTLYVVQATRYAVRIFSVQRNNRQLIAALRVPLADASFRAKSGVLLRVESDGFSGPKHWRMVYTGDRLVAALDDYSATGRAIVTFAHKNALPKSDSYEFKSLHSAVQFLYDSL